MSRGLSGRSLAGAEPQKATRVTKTFCDVPLRGRTEFTQQREQAPSASWASEDRNGHGKEANGIKQMRQDDAITDKPRSCLCQEDGVDFFELRLSQQPRCGRSDFQTHQGMDRKTNLHAFPNYRAAVHCTQRLSSQTTPLALSRETRVASCIKASVSMVGSTVIRAILFCLNPFCKLCRNVVPQHRTDRALQASVFIAP